MSGSKAKRMTSPNGAKFKTMRRVKSKKASEMIQDKIKKIYKAKAARIEKVSSNSHLIEIDLPFEIDIKAGQFISIYCKGLTLRRPFSVYSHFGNKIGILFKERGAGTKYIKSLKPNDIIDIIGPLGNGFNIKNKKALLVGAGIGAAPMAFLKSELDKKGIENLFVCGFLNKNEIPDCINIDKIYTDDGSYGEEGSVLNYSDELINTYKPEIIYTCGPYIVLKTIAETAQQYGLEVQVAMEKIMACGIGVCRGCVIDIKKNGEIVNATVCKDGPVFLGSEVVWQ